MIGSGKNPYQFISVFDCAEACARGLEGRRARTRPIISARSIRRRCRKLLGDLIRHAGSKSILLPTPAWAVKRTLDLLDVVNMPIMDPEQYLIADEMCMLDVVQGQARARLGAAISRRGHADRRLYRISRQEGRPRRRRHPPYRPNRRLADERHDQAGRSEAAPSSTRRRCRRQASPSPT